MKAKFPVDPANTAMSDANFGEEMKKYLADIKAEAAYFTSINGQRGAYIVLDIPNASQIPVIAAPMFYWLKAEIEFMPAMLPEDLVNAGETLAAAAKEWG
jgi:hypothetical protein